MKIESYTNALAYLNTFISPITFKRIEDNAGFDPLERMRTLLGLLGNPEKKFRSVLVTGTSGKGSTAYLISHVLKIAGYKVGLTISPHLQKVNERLQINGKEISDNEFIKLLKTSILPSIERISKMKVGKPSYFEILIAMAFEYFNKQKIDIAVVEVGIEGKYDATNALNPLMVVLTNISLDHTQILGDTVEKIAKEAVGAIKSEKRSIRQAQDRQAKSEKQENKLIVIAGVRQKLVIEIVEEKCKKVGAKLFRIGKDFDHSIIKNYKLSLLGEYQKENASLAVEAVSELSEFGFKVSEKNIRQALSTAFFPGRFEVLRLPSVAQDKMSSTLILDGAHNPAKMQAFISSLQKLFPDNKKVFIIAFKKDKNIREMLRQIVKAADGIIVTEFHKETDVSLHASADAGKIAEVIKKLSKKVIKVEKDSGKALNKAFNYPITQLPNCPIIVVTGSLYLVGEIRSLLT